MSFFAKFRKQRVAMAGAVVLLLVTLAAVLAPLIAPYDPLAQNLEALLQGPSGSHWLGTDALGRDVLSRLLYAARVSLPAALLALGVAVAIGVPCGLIMGYVGGKVDRVGMVCTDVILTFPGVMLAIALIAVFGNNMVNAMVALGVVYSPNFVRLARAETLTVRRENYVAAAELLGYPARRLLARHILPNIAPPLLVQAFLTFGFALLAQSGLSFLGLGVQPPYPGWGAMLAEGASYMSQNPVLILPPGLAIALTVLAANLMGDGIRDSIGAGVRRGAATSRPRGAGRLPRPAPLTTGVPAGEPGVLEVSGLSVGYDSDGETRLILEDVSLRVPRGKTLALVGESGSGKSVTALAVMGLLRPPLGVLTGSARLDGQELIGARRSELDRLRGSAMSMVFQDPLASLNPSFTIGNQLVETIRRHTGLDRAAARARALELLERVHIPNAAERLKAYPHELSGGMAQRVMIALATACRPKLIIADEPTTALDVTVEAEILDLFRELQADLGASVLFITHDMGVVADIADEAAVMYAGQIVEQAPVDELFTRPTHPYTKALLDCIPSRHQGQDALPTIPGVVPDPGRRPVGCRFADRCTHAMDDCADPQPLRITSGGAVRCVLADSGPHRTPALTVEKEVQA
ncbi:dipeptide/oligopeptide/nickel ABC transporter permease/ATP-binding protein [Streptomyces sp. NPDC057623]|uniref:dipeptide/oligopeptide/nickel ABC transporter permease/ATP-binding protein n=1 Tax=Streptomyces sp. NPDC057623 TaxID=3346187 RepID=UPI003678CFAA